MLVPASARTDLLMQGRPDVVGGHYHVERRIGEGSFGVIYEDVCDLKEPQKSNAPQLKDEYRTYRLLTGSPGIPTIYWFGQECGFNVLVMELLGPSLEEVFDKCGRKFSVGTVCMLAIEMINRIQSVHEKGLIYRDIKPDNFLLGSKDITVYLVDFGMAKYYLNPVTNQHIPYSEKKSLSGTARYMSINTHRGREQSRRDDLEALGHVFLYFLRGSLPWQGIKAATNKEKYDKIGDKKQAVPIGDLCSGYPEEFARYMAYVRESLDFDQKPNYEYLKSLFRTLLAKLGPDASTFDWLKKGINLVLPPPTLKPTATEPTSTAAAAVIGVKSSNNPNPMSARATSPVRPVADPEEEQKASNKSSPPSPPDQPQQPDPLPSPPQRRKKSIWRRLWCL